MASLEVVKSTAFFGPAQIINRTKSLKINILIGLTLINMVIKTNQISYSTDDLMRDTECLVYKFIISDIG